MTLIISMSPIFLNAGTWKSYEVTYGFDPEFKNGPEFLAEWKKRDQTVFKTKTITLKIPSDMKPGERIRGVIASNRSFEDFAHKNRIAMYDKTGNLPYGGPHKTMLKEAAKLTGHPELEHAGAIVYGTSNGGRFAAHFAHFWPHRTLAVILDHSWTSGSPNKKVSTYEYAQLPISLGVPYFFNSSQKDAKGNKDRRKLHHSWCKSATKSGQACTAVISWEDVGHGEPGDRTLQGVWLEDVMTLRVPAVIPMNGKPYQLLKVNPKTQGGHMSVKIFTKGLISHYSDIAVGPIKKIKPVTCWLPGAKSAALTLEWLKKNKGKVKRDFSQDIITAPQYQNLKPYNMTIYKFLKTGKYNSAYKQIKKTPEPDDIFQKQSYQSLKNQVADKIRTQIKQIMLLQKVGDVYQLQVFLRTGSNFRGIPPYDDQASKAVALLKSKEVQKDLVSGRQFYYTLAKMNKKRSMNDIKIFAKISQSNPDSLYAKMAKVVSDRLSDDLNAPLDIESIRAQL
ncbi:hypothetical protein [Lentisphaera araneosa]|nr:hypothetical protein [Lentisphaera araneosa]